jgi:hypothetical protein
MKLNEKTKNTLDLFKDINYFYLGCLSADNAYTAFGNIKIFGRELNQRSVGRTFNRRRRDPRLALSL